MAGKQTIVGEVAREYCAKFPTASTHAIARMLMRDQKSMFVSYDAARSAVRYARAQKKNGRQLTPKPVAFAAIELPKSAAVPVLPAILDVRGKGLVISDVHLPYHDETALRAALTFAESQKHTDFLILNGDILDCYQLSRYVKDPRQRHFKDELKTVAQFLAYVTAKFRKVVYKFGNHEVRYEHYLMQHAAELLDVEGMALNEQMRLSELGIQHVPANVIMYVGALTILHGHEYGKGISNPVNPARGMYLKANACTLSGHLHQTSRHNKADIRRRLTSCFSTGCLCDLSPEYATLNGWDHGLALLTTDGHDFTVSTHSIIDGKVF